MKNFKNFSSDDMVATIVNTVKAAVEKPQPEPEHEHYTWSRFGEGRKVTIDGQTAILL